MGMVTGTGKGGDDRPEWLKYHTAQLALAVTMQQWTLCTTNALQGLFDGKADALETHDDPFERASENTRASMDLGGGAVGGAAAGRQRATCVAPAPSSAAALSELSAAVAGLQQQMAQVLARLPPPTTEGEATETWSAPAPGPASRLSA